jgi:hypothetical protein
MANNDAEVRALPVEQMDRDAALALMRQVRGYAVGLPNDNHSAIQAFARHRIAAEARSHDGEWVLVPRELSFEMLKAGCDALDNGGAVVTNAWSAMLSAVPLFDEGLK